MAVQDKYKKQPKLDFTNDDWEDIPQQQNQNIDFNSPEFQNYNPNVEIQQPQKEMPQTQKSVDAFGTGGINMAGLRAPITGAMTGVAGLVGKALGNNDKTFWENYQAGKDFVNQQNEQAKENNPTTYYAGNFATGIPLALAGYKKVGGSGIIKNALEKGKTIASSLSNKLPIADTLKSAGKIIKSKGAKKALTSYLAYKGLDTIADKIFSGGESGKGTNY
jgi:hypothetical protein